MMLNLIPRDDRIELLVLLIIRHVNEKSESGEASLSLLKPLCNYNSRRNLID